MTDLSGAPIVFKKYKETHCEGIISIENMPKERMIKGDLGIQISTDGRVWICIDGVAFLRFKPDSTIPEPPHYSCGRCGYEGRAQTNGVAVWCPSCQMNDQFIKNENV